MQEYYSCLSPIIGISKISHSSGQSPDVGARIKRASICNADKNTLGGS